jgi:hypothetical protein
MGSYKKLESSDVIVIPYVASKAWVFSYTTASLLNTNSNIHLYGGQNVSGTFNPSNDPIDNNGLYKRFMYNSINHLFYQEYTGSLDTSSLASSLNYISSSQQRPTSSYYNYDYNDNIIKTYPTGINEEITVLSISRNLFGTSINPGTFNISSSLYNLQDDENGNIFDIQNGNIHVGNIFYSLGLIIITNQDYINIIYIPNPSILATLNWSNLQSHTPYVNTTLFIYVNEVLIVPEIQNGTGTFITSIGDTILVRCSSDLSQFPWPPQSTASINISQNGTVLHTNTIYTQNNNWDTYTFVVANTGSIDVYGTSNSSADLYTNNLLIVNNISALSGSIRVEIQDTTNSDIDTITTNTAPFTNHGVFFNTTKDSNPLNINILNYWSEGINILVTQTSGYNQNQNVITSGSLEFNGLVKNQDITISINNPIATTTTSTTTTTTPTTTTPTTTTSTTTTTTSTTTTTTTTTTPSPELTFNIRNNSSITTEGFNLFLDTGSIVGTDSVGPSSTIVVTSGVLGNTSSHIVMELSSGYLPSSATLSGSFGMITGMISGSTVPPANITFGPIDLSFVQTSTLIINP